MPGNLPAIWDDMAKGAERPSDVTRDLYSASGEVGTNLDMLGTRGEEKAVNVQHRREQDATRLRKDSRAS